MAKKILIVDDEKPLANALKLKLEKEGFETMAVYNGKDAVEAIGKSDFDMILLDLIMPEMTGFSVLEDLKKKGSKIPVVVCSNLGQEEDFAKAKTLGAADYFVKSDTPITEIVDKVKNTLGG